MTPEAFCAEHDLTLDQFYGREPVEGRLDLSSVESLPAGFAPTVGGSLWLCDLKFIPDGFAPVVGGYLFLSRLKSLPDGFAPVVGGSLDLSRVESLPDGFAPVVGGSLYLNNLESIPAGFAPTVGGCLDLYAAESIPDDFTPTVGDLCLRDFEDTNHQTTKPPALLSWQDGKYILVDGIFTEVVSHSGNVWRVKRIGESKVTYVVTDGEKYAHGATLEIARDDLVFKIGDSDKSDFEAWTVDTEVTFEEAVACYRVVTGACSFGVKEFTERHDLDQKATYVIKDVIEMVEGSYGASEFKEFFQVAA